MEANRAGELRGFVSQAQFYLPPMTPIGYALRSGSLTSIKTLYSNARPVSSVTPLAACDVSSDLELHYRMAEQLPTIFDLDTTVDPRGNGTPHADLAWLNFFFCTFVVIMYFLFFYFFLFAHTFLFFPFLF